MKTLTRIGTVAPAIAILAIAFAAPAQARGICGRPAMQGASVYDDHSGTPPIIIKDPIIVKDPKKK